MIRSLVSTFFAGLLFGLGLLLSGMTNPVKVLGFLDLAGAWDPSLVLVMAGAISVAVIPFAIARHRQASWLGEPMRLPTTSQIDRRLVVGSLLFGVGWGMAGLCPGPAVVNAVVGHADAMMFVVAMLAGMGAHTWWQTRRG